MMKTRVLVLGASGMVGHVVSLRLYQYGDEFEVVTAARDLGSLAPDWQLDASDFSALEDGLLKIKPDVCINAIGILNNSGLDFLKMRKLNSDLPIFLSNLGKQQGFQLIHISTDCVFSGKKGNHLEHDLPDAEDLYALTKQDGEKIHSEHLVIRTSIIGPEIRPNAIGLFHWYTSQFGEVNGFQNVIWSGVTTLTLSDAIIYAIHQKTSGLLHLVNNQTISKCALIQLIDKYFPNKIRQIIPTPIPVSDKSLISTRKDVTFHVPSYEHMMSALRQWMELHPENYQAYLQRV